MTKFKIITGVSILYLSCTGIAFGGEMESKEDKIARAVSAAPANISDKATIMDMDGTILREGTNGWTCLPGVRPLKGDMNPMCNDAVWMRWMKAAETKSDFSTDVIGISYMMMGDSSPVNNNDPNATDTNDGGVWVQEGPHLMMLMPKAAMNGLSRDPFGGGYYVMWGDSPLAHVMIPLAANKKIDR